MNRYFVTLATLFLVASFASSQNQTPQQAIERMVVPSGFKVRLVASEPMIRQPVSMSFDERGRLWVIQYLQYPNPEGLKAVKQDQYLRTVWDRIPEPPPKGPKGADRITILYDPDEHGQYRKSRDFVTGLNLASGMCIGHDGVYIVQPPYLLFYPDKDHDDVPDGDPEVLLSGFGMEDSHSYANSLQWGPDGWLYGAHGSTVSASIRNPADPKAPAIEFQQGIWRYHPLSKRFELFSEGGGNTWGLDFDRQGRVIAGTNWGGFAMLHQVQGAYHVKGFAKHGPLHNPHTYGYFEHVPYQGFKGGHVTCGGIVYQGDTYPAEYQHQYIGGNLLSNDLYRHDMFTDGSSFRAKHGGDFLLSKDPWFRPVDCLTGPDGSLYVADWHDKRAAHLDPVDNWDRTNGRIYKIDYVEKTKAYPQLDLGKKTSEELVALLGHPNMWYSSEARRLLAGRRDKKIIPALKKLLRDRKDQTALEALWALYVSGGFDDEFAQSLLVHGNEYVRAWTIRLLGDERKVSPKAHEWMIALAQKDPSPWVRSQLACTAKRLPAKEGLAVCAELLQRTDDLKDQHIPLLLWWAIEDKAVSNREQVVKLFESEGFWKLPLVRQTILERIARRYVAEGKPEDLSTAASLIRMAPGPEEWKLLLKGIEQALAGNRLEKTPEELLTILREFHRQGKLNLREWLSFAVRLGDPNGLKEVQHHLSENRLPQDDRFALIRLLGESANADVLPVLLKLYTTAEQDALKDVTLSALESFADPKVAATLLETYPKLTPDLKTKARNVLLARPASALAMLRAIDAKRLEKTELTLNQLRQIQRFADKEIDGLVTKHWGRVGGDSSGEKRARISWLNIAISRSKADMVQGKNLYTKTCANCHQLFGEGQKIGPDLTTADRKNRDYLLTHVVDPSVYIRPEYMTQIIRTVDGRTFEGVVVETAGETVTLANSQAQKTTIQKKNIEEMVPSAFSVMPEKLLDTLTDQQVADLFSYLQSEPPKKK